MLLISLYSMQIGVGLGRDMQMIKIAIKKIKIILSLGFVILSLFGNWPVYQNVPQAQAAITGVTGTASNGSTITITGSGFGTRGDYGGSQNFLNLAWSSFDTGISGGNFGLNGQNDAAWTFSNSSGRLGGWVRKRYDPAINESVRRLGGLTPNNGGSLSNTTGTYYTTFWFRPEAGAIGKFWRIYGDHGDIWINVNGDNMSGGPGTGLSGLSDVPGNPTPTSLWGSAFQFTTGG